ncbi:MBL fold metallo-hydrolase [Clostridium estertheticum]|uniref:MBL fold metallo-hydrolase n=1 Tax=Clostridium estertheticum TaxID=238834 RepID=UPI001CF5FC74|nr:MBL fold metallo-hydrolase [Clostridium estertheticum]MCB2353139.1 MBL fold metallo-hydrolase [Clostridium estertheticum]WAG41495.1 MBL fold metallo-hydrolase [Clostridium estertheticum]
MNEILVNIYPARSGDAFLVRFPNKKNIVIDMGFEDTYRNYIKDDLDTINKDGERINLLVITHIDEDHIEGAIEFIKENSFSENPKIVGIDEIWHNSYRHLQLNKNGSLIKGDQEIEIIDEIKKSNSSTNREGVNESKIVSAFQGSTLASYLYAYNYNWNGSFRNMAVSTNNKYKDKIDKININLLSPNSNKLKSLSRKWLSFLKGKKFNFKITKDEIFDDAYELYVRNIDDFELNEEKQISYKNENIDVELLKDIRPDSVDKSESNGSSIAFEFIYDNIKMLFLGDCHEDILIDKFKEEASKDTYYDLIKLPHHGSLRNNCDWIKYVRAKYYIFSTDSIIHNEHPSKELISKIIFKNKGSSEKIFLVFNYKNYIIKEFDNKELKDLYNYEFIYPKGNEKVVLPLQGVDINGI